MTYMFSSLNYFLYFSDSKMLMKVQRLGEHKLQSVNMNDDVWGLKEYIYHRTRAILCNGHYNTQCFHDLCTSPVMVH